MRYLSIFPTVLIFIFSMQAPVWAASVPATQTVTLDVKNMTCAVCPITVKKALTKVAGVAQATVDFESKTATVTYDPKKTDTQALIKATTDAGYPSTVHGR